MAEEIYKKEYPVGIQSFEKLRRSGYKYVDKTRFVYQLAHTGDVYFLSRPRRFGKSMLLSTLEAYFRGQRELFDGLEICQLEKEWEKYPVLQFSFGGVEASDPDKLKSSILTTLGMQAEEYGLTLNQQSEDPATIFGVLIQRLSEKTGKNVVVLIDEYDKGILETIHDEERLKRNQALLRPFFAQLKDKDKYIQFAFITGVARFRHYTLFSGMNNLQDISMDPKYATLCGITVDEMKRNFNDGINALASKYETDYDGAVALIVQKYNGYRFTSAVEFVINPFSLLYAFSQNNIDQYWLASGTSKVFVEYLADTNFDVADMAEEWFSGNDLGGLYDSDNPIPLLYQTGYLTIAEADGNDYRLRIPNGEVRGALVKDLMPLYMGTKNKNMTREARKINEMLINGDLQAFINKVDSIIAGVPYEIFDKKKKEDSYHLIMYMVCMMVGVDTRCEEPMADGRPDLVALTKDRIYIFEFKLDHSAEEALAQIDDKHYARKYQTDGREIYKIGASFSSERRNIDRWLVKPPDAPAYEIVPED